MPQATQHCAECNEDHPSHCFVWLTEEEGSRELCSRCFNRVAAEICGNAFEHPEFVAVTMDDANGRPHTFQFRTLFRGDTFMIDAIEDGDDPGRYELSVIATADEDPMTAFQRLYERMRRELERRHLEEGKHGLRITDEGIVRGRIAWDSDQSERLPLVAVDGRAVTWDELGKMLMTYEGWGIKIQAFDGSEDIE